LTRPDATGFGFCAEVATTLYADWHAQGLR
jgi:hypothetical protein